MDQLWGVVLGASSGTGAAICRSVARDPGLNIFGAHRGHYSAAADALVSEIESLGRRGVMRVGDAGTAEAARQGAEMLRETAGPRSVKLFVHSLASASLGPLMPGAVPHLTPQQIEKSFSAMAHSFVYWVQELVARDLFAEEARILGLTNTLHDSLVANCGLVAATKGALEMYVRQLAVELGPRGHRVNLLKFSTVITPALERIFGPEAIAVTEKFHARLNPAGRICTVAEVGDFVSLLAGPKAAWFNGATIDFTGGTTLRLTDVILEYMRGKKHERD